MHREMISVEDKENDQVSAKGKEKRTKLLSGQNWWLREVEPVEERSGFQ